MNYKQLLNCLLTITILICAQINVAAQRQPRGDNVVLEWNQISIDTLISTNTANLSSQRLGAIFQTADFELAQFGYW